MALFVDSMVILRPTRKVRLSAQERETREFSSDTALGDWYVNRIIVHRQPLLILISSVSLLPTLTAARDVQSLPDRLADLVGDRLVRLGIQAKLITAEKKAMQPTQVARTIDRSVVGIMVDFAKALPYYLSAGSNENTLRLAEDSLARTPCYAGQSDRVIFPDQRAREVLREKWGTLDNTL